VSVAEYKIGNEMRESNKEVTSCQQTKNKAAVSNHKGSQKVDVVRTLGHWRHFSKPTHTHHHHSPTRTSYAKTPSISCSTAEADPGQRHTQFTRIGFVAHGDGDNGGEIQRVAGHDEHGSKDDTDDDDMDDDALQIQSDASLPSRQNGEERDKSGAEAGADADVTEGLDAVNPTKLFVGGHCAGVNCVAAARFRGGSGGGALYYFGAVAAFKRKREDSCDDESEEIQFVVPDMTKASEPIGRNFHLAGDLSGSIHGDHPVQRRRTSVGQGKAAVDAIRWQGARGSFKRLAQLERSLGGATDDWGAAEGSVVELGYGHEYSNNSESGGGHGDMNPDTWEGTRAQAEFDHKYAHAQLQNDLQIESGWLGDPNFVAPANGAPGCAPGYAPAAGSHSLVDAGSAS
jgi:hypothetical protein